MTEGLKFEDTNLAMLGSIFEKKLRAERADKEPEWKKIKNEPGLYIWRIEKFNVVAWPKDQYGNFYQGDTYIILNIYKKDDQLKYVAHMWVGKESTCDETGTGAYKIVELDDYFNRMVTLVYEAQDYESKSFKSYFKTITILEGGIESGFKKVKPEEYRPRLLHVSGEGACVTSKEVPFEMKSLNNSDVFIIDNGLKIYIWRGKKSSPFEKMNATMLCNKIKSDRGGKPSVVSFEDDEESANILKQFFKEFNPDAVKDSSSKGIPDDMKLGCHKKMMKLSDANGELELTEVPYKKETLCSDDTFLIDRGDNIFVWVGTKASPAEKKFGFVFAKKYQDKEKRNRNLPVIVVQENEGTFAGEIDLCFK